MARREQVDSKENAIDNQHDLPVYHRIQRLLAILNSHINNFDNDKKLSFRSITLIILQFDKTFAPALAKILVRIAQNKEELEDILTNFQENLSEKYFERILIQVSSLINNEDSCPFIQQLNVDEKLHLAQWFMKEKNRPLLVFDLLRDHVFNQSGVDREQCQSLLRQMRENDNLFLRQQAMEYTVPWKEDGGIIGEDADDPMSVSNHSDMS